MIKINGVIASGRSERGNLRQIAASGFSMRVVGVALLAMTFMTGCDKSPFNRTQNASGGGPTGSFTGTNSFVIFSNELGSGGGAFEYPGSEGQSLSFNDTSNPVSRRSIRYSWTGEPVASQSVFAGFDLMHTPT